MSPPVTSKHRIRQKIRIRASLSDAEIKPFAGPLGLGAPNIVPGPAPRWPLP